MVVSTHPSYQYIARFPSLHSPRPTDYTHCEPRIQSQKYRPMGKLHVLLVTFPTQGHINPTLQFAKRLVTMGIDVTFATSIYARRRIGKIPKGISFAPFSDGYDDGFKQNVDDPKHYMNMLRTRGSETLKETILASREQGRPISCLVYTLLLPWAAEVAREVSVPSALLWIQPATVLDIYYYYFHGFSDEITKNLNGEFSFPGISTVFSTRDLPSFLLPSSSDMYSFALPTFKEQLDTLDVELRPKVLVNTFDALEPDALKSIEHYELIGIGPLIPSAFLDGKDPSDKSFGADLFTKCDDDYIDWLNSKPISSVVYISFGSLLNLPKEQMEEIAKGLLECGRSFLWVIRANENADKEVNDDELSCLEELKKIGKIVPWCSQLEVLTHPSLGCFVTHCGWNSTMESLSCGVPVVAFPHWTDQGTNAKLIEDVWRTGVRVNVEEDGGMVKSSEILRCIEEVMDSGEKGKELRENAMKWKYLAREAMEEEGSSNKNLKTFFEEVEAI